MRKNKKTLIIAEIGVNHNGKLSIAKKLIKKASDAKADIVKFQIFKPENLVTPNAKKASYQIGKKEKLLSKKEPSSNKKKRKNISKNKTLNTTKQHSNIKYPSYLKNYKNIFIFGHSESIGEIIYLLQPKYHLGNLELIMFKINYGNHV